MSKTYVVQIKLIELDTITGKGVTLQDYQTAFTYSQAEAEAKYNEAHERLDI